VFSRLDFILGARVRGKAAVVGGVFLGACALSVLLFLLLGNGKVGRVLYFPDGLGTRLVAERRSVPRHPGLEESAREVADGVLLGPMSPDLARLFPRGVIVQSLVVHDGVLSVDLSAAAALPDAEAPLAGTAAVEALVRSLRANFPRLREIAVTVDGQVPRSRGEKKI
jgi:hypothetical protein